MASLKQTAARQTASRHMATRHMAGGERPTTLESTATMYKPASLRAHLLLQVPGLQAEGLHTFVDAGHIEATASASMSYVYHYTLQTIITDYAGHSDAVILPILTWLRTHQPELFLSTTLMADAFKFEADILSHNTYDFGITLKLSERVSVNTEGRTATVQHHGEPPLEPYADVDRWELFVLGESVGTWDTPPFNP
jgi:P2 phage tail completion protein R (GpR)